MKSKFKALKKIFVCLGLLLILPFSASATTDQSAEIGSIYLPAETILNTPYWAAGQSINLNSQMKDDVYLAGANIVVSGPIDGDLFVAGSNIIINSEIKGDLRVAGGMVTINSKINGNVTAMGGVITLGKTAQVGKNLIALGGNVELYGKIEKNLYSASGNLLINNEIKGDVFAAIDTEGSLVLFPEANILGKLEYTAPSAATIHPGAKVNEEKFTQLKIQPAQPVNNGKGFVLTFWLIGLLSSLVVGLVVVYLLKDQTIKVKNQLLNKIPLTILKGALYLIVTPIALLILAITIIGAPLAMILGVIFCIALYLCKIFIGVFLGDWLLRKLFKQKEAQSVWSMMLGVLVIYLICLIPFVGILAKLVIALWGIGAIMAVAKKELNLENS
jgi:cytoskeletal protein CcmA (bactofilin family)